jgi:voltage-gated potassium channel
LENKPIDDPNLFFIKGNVTEDNLSRAKLANASTVLVLGDDTLDTGARDAKSVLTTLTIESMNPDAYTVVELDNEDNVKHCKRAKADEIVVGSEFSSRLISRAALDHGITIVISELLSSRIGNDLQKVPIPESLHNKRFGEVLLEMKNRNDSIAIAVQRSAGEVISNPPKDFVIAPDDFLIVISPDKRLAPA